MGHNIKMVNDRNFYLEIFPYSAHNAYNVKCARVKMLIGWSGIKLQWLIEFFKSINVEINVFFKNPKMLSIDFL